MWPQLAGDLKRKADHNRVGLLIRLNCQEIGFLQIVRHAGLEKTGHNALHRGEAMISRIVFKGGDLLARAGDLLLLLLRGRHLPLRSVDHNRARVGVIDLNVSGLRKVRPIVDVDSGLLDRPLGDLSLLCLLDGARSPFIELKFGSGNAGNEEG